MASGQQQLNQMIRLSLTDPLEQKKAVFFEECHQNGRVVTHYGKGFRVVDAKLLGRNLIEFELEKADFFTRIDI